MDYISHYSSPLGDIILLSRARSEGYTLTGLWFEGHRYLPGNLLNTAVEGELPVFTLTKKWLDIYFKGQKPDFTPPLQPIGTPFQLRVWDILNTIPYGSTLTYGDIAKIIAKEQGIDRMSSRAVGAAVGRNPISIIIPCHRVIGAKGKLTGYGGGIERKVELLKLEGVNTRSLILPSRQSHTHI